MTRLRATAGKLAPAEIFFVGSAVIAGFISDQFLLLAVLSALFFALIRKLAYGRFTRRSPADIPIGILVMLLPVTYWATALPVVTIPHIFRLLGGVSLYFAIVNWATSEDRLRWLARGTAAGGFSLALFSLVSVHWFTNKLSFIPASLYRQFHLLVSDAIHPNVMAGNLVILLPVAMGVILFAWKSMKWPERIFFGVTVACMSIVLMLTVSRGAWLAIGVVLVLMASLRWRWGWLVCVLAAAAGGAAIYIVGGDKILEAIASSNTLGGFNGRIEVWSRAILMIEDFPLTGIGMGSFGPVADAMYPFLLFAPGSIPHAHNLYLQIAVDLGIPGLLAWLVILAVIITFSIQIYRSGRLNRDGWTLGLGAGLLCSQLALAVHGFLDAVTWGMVRPAPIVWALWGFAAAAWLHMRKA